MGCHFQEVRLYLYLIHLDPYHYFQDVHLDDVKEEFIEISQDVTVLSKTCPEDLSSVKPEEVSYLNL